MTINIIDNFIKIIRKLNVVGDFQFQICVILYLRSKSNININRNNRKSNYTYSLEVFSYSGFVVLCTFVILNFFVDGCDKQTWAATSVVRRKHIKFIIANRTQRTHKVYYATRAQRTHTEYYAIRAQRTHTEYYASKS